MPFLVTAMLLFSVAGSGDLPASQASSDVGGVLVVGGVEIPPDEIRRFILYGPGREVLERRQMEVLVELEILRHAPAERARFALPDADLRAEAARRREYEARRFPTLDPDTEVRRAFRSQELHDEGLRVELLFDRTFIPDDQALWPDVTFEAFRGVGGELLIDDFRETYERRCLDLSERLSTWDGVSPEPRLEPEDTAYRSILREIVREFLLQAMSPRTADGSLPPSIACTLSSPERGGEPLVLKTADLWAMLRPTVSSEEILEARRFLALAEATRQRLAAEGHLLDREVAIEYFNRPRAFFGPPGTWSPFKEAALTYVHLRESFRKANNWRLVTTPAGELPPVLEAHLDQANQTMGLAWVDAEVLLVSAFDFPASRWKDNGWRNALEKANGLMRMLVVTPERWSDTLDSESEFWELPPPAVGSGCGLPFPSMFGGNHYAQSFWDMRQELGESDYTEFVSGNRLTQQIFFDSRVGMIEGPFAGPWGYYLVKVHERRPVQRPLNLKDGVHLNRLRASWAKDAFREYAWEALDRASVDGSLSR